MADKTKAKRRVSLKMLAGGELAECLAISFISAKILLIISSLSIISAGNLEISFISLNIPKILEYLQNSNNSIKLDLFPNPPQTNKFETALSDN